MNLKIIIKFQLIFNHNLNHIHFFYLKMNDIISFIPLSNRCLIQKILTSPITKGGVYLSQRLIEENSRIGRVIAVGPGEINEKGIFLYLVN